MYMYICYRQFGQYYIYAWFTSTRLLGYGSTIYCICNWSHWRCFPFEASQRHHEVFYKTLTSLRHKTIMTFYAKQTARPKWSQHQWWSWAHGSPDSISRSCSYHDGSVLGLLFVPVVYLHCHLAKNISDKGVRMLPHVYTQILRANLMSVQLRRNVVQPQCTICHHLYHGRWQPHGESHQI